MSKFLNGLNPEQKKAVMHTNGPLLVLAGAGSGKTRVVTNRIGYLLEKKVCCPNNILAITFTNKAAGEMKERLKKTVGTKADDMVVCTSHSLGNRILREFHKEADVPKNFKIIPEQEKLILLKSKLREVTARNEYIDLFWLASRIGLAKNAGISPENYPEDWEKGPLVRRSYTAYQEFLRQKSALDFDDLLLRPLHLLKQDKSVLKKLRERFTYISVDEYQDTNRIQFETVKLLASPKNNICAVGDDDQGIYSWRGADISNILSFNHAFRNTTMIKLEQNYRSTGTILSAANAVIQKNSKRTEKAMWSGNGNGDPIDHYQADDELDEAQWVGQTIADLHKAKTAHYNEIALLVRTNEQTRIYEDELQRRRIPYRIPGGGGFYDRKEVKDLMGYLLFIANPLDEMSLSRILRVPSWHISKETMRIIDQKAGANKWSLWQTFQSYEMLKLQDDQKENLGRFTKFVQRFIGLFKKDSLAATFRKMVTELKYREYLQLLYAERKDEKEKRLAVVSELEHSIDLFAKSRKKVSLATFIEQVLIMLNEKEEDDHSNAVSLMTMHASKGMEFPIVFLPGLDDNVIPSKRSVEEGNLEEERRLFYVAMTRAEKRLFLSWPSTRYLYNKNRDVKHCRFIHDIPENLLIAPIGKRESEIREKKLAEFFKEMREKFKTGAIGS